VIETSLVFSQGERVVAFHGHHYERNTSSFEVVLAPRLFTLGAS
jgi:hypothetical protein